MISAALFRANIFPVFRLAKLTNVGFEVVYKGQVFDVTLTPTDKIPKLTRTRKQRARKRGVKDLVNLDNCPECGELAVSGVCLNKRCTKSHLN